MQKMLETWVRSLGREDCSGRGHGNPVYSCLENSTDKGAWRVYSQGRKELDTTELTEHTYTHIKIQRGKLRHRTPPLNGLGLHV